jgi:outer membrane biosynthesis protein TonB
MFLSKFWTLILVIIVAMLLSVIYLVPSSINESRVGNVRALIVKDRLQMESILKMEARSRLDTTIVFAVDQVVREQLFEAVKRKDPTQVPMEIKEKLLSQMRKLNDGLTTFKADILIAVDKDGIVIGQVGENERSSGYSLKGFPLVQAALRGYLMDDSWFFDGKLYRMSARPVIHSGMYVGAIIHGQKMSKDFADILSRASDSQVGIYVEDHIVAVATPGTPAAETPEKAVEKGKEKDPKKAAAPEAAGVFATDAQINTILVDDVFKDKDYMASGRSSVILSKGKYYVVSIKMVGEARKNNAGIVLIRQVPKVGGVMEFVKSIKKQELAAVPWWQIGALTFALLFIGVLLIYLEGDRPKSRFLKEVEKMVSKEGERLNIYLFRGKYRKLADAINRAIDKAVQVLVSKATSEAPSVAKILSGVPKDSRLSKPAFEVPGQISLDDIPPPPPADDKAKGKRPRTPTAPSISGSVPVQPAPKPAPAPAQAPAPVPRPVAQAPAVPQKPAPAPVQVPMQPAPLPPPKPMTPAAKPQPPGPVKPADAKAGISAWGGGLDEEETRIYEGDKGGILPAIPADRVPPVQPAPPRPAAGIPAVLDGEEELFRRIYEEFYKTKVACGENVDNLTFDRFRATLRKQEEAIRERTKCKKVEFRVYVKDGKAALKASPIK